MFPSLHVIVSGRECYHRDFMLGIPVGLIGFGSAARVFHAPAIRAVAGLELSGDCAGQLHREE
jgi:hypothetical protein